MEETRFVLHWIDYTLIAIYFIGIILHGLYIARKGHEGADAYFLAGRDLPWYLIGFSLFASNMSGASFVGLMGGAYDNGVTIFNYEWTATLVLIFFAIFILPSYLRARVSTVPQYLENRYDVRSRRAFSLFTILAIMLIDTAGALYAGGLVISNTIEFLNLWQAVAVLALVAGLYTILGGLSAVVLTDTVQAILLILGAGLIFVLGLYDVGGWEALWQKVEPDKQQLMLSASNDFLPWPGIWGVVLLGFYYWTINQFIVQRTLGAKSLDAGRKGAVFAGFLKIPNIFLMVIPGLIALALYPNLETPDLAFPTLAFDLMPIGVRGLVMAALIAAIMSSLDSALNSAGTLVTLDFVKPLKPELSDATLVKIGRAVTAIAMVIGAVYAPMIAGFESLFEYFQSSLSYVVPPIVVVYVLGLFWPRLNGNGAFWTILLSLVVGIPLFICKEVLDLWSAVGLPDIHYTIMSSIMMLLGIASHIALSYMVRSDEARQERVREAVWDREAFRRDTLTIESPWYKDFKVQAIGVFLLMVAFIWWFW